MYLFDPSRAPTVETRHAASPDRWKVGGGRSAVGEREEKIGENGNIILPVRKMFVSLQHENN